jgi:anti-sigma factor RsiW
MKIPEATLIAYVDGELDADARAEVDAAAKTDAEVAAALARHQALRGRVAGAYADVVEEPVPEELEAFIRNVAPHIAPHLAAQAGPKAVKSAEVVDLSALRAARTPKPPAKSLPPWAMAAACFVCGVMVAGAFYAQAPGLLKTQGRDLIAQGRLAQALDLDLAAAPTTNGLVKVGLSFKTQDGGYCRTFSATSGQALAGVACREGAGWKVRAAVFSGPSTAGQAPYRTAASDMPTAIRTEVESLIDGAPLDARGEAAARSAGWRGAKR